MAGWTEFFRSDREYILLCSDLAAGEGAGLRGGDIVTPSRAQIGTGALFHKTRMFALTVSMALSAMLTTIQSRFADFHCVIWSWTSVLAASLVAAVNSWVVSVLGGVRFRHMRFGFSCRHHEIGTPLAAEAYAYNALFAPGASWPRGPPP